MASTGVGVVAVVLSFLGYELIARKNIWGFLAWTLANILLVIKFTALSDPAQWDMVALYVGFQLFAIRGYLKWKEPAQVRIPSTNSEPPRESQPRKKSHPTLRIPWYNSVRKEETDVQDTAT